VDRSGPVEVGDVELFVREIRPQLPPSPPLVAIHGGPSWDHSYLLPGLLPVATARYVILVDMRGCGRTSRDLVPDAYQPEFVIDDLARLMEVLGHEQVDLLGFSTGGQVALLFAEAQPDRIRRLILASTTAYPDTAAHLRGWDEYERRVADIPPVDDGPDDLDTTIQWAVNGASTSVWNLDLLDDYRALLDEVRFSGDWLESFRTGRAYTLGVRKTR
jgi:pimeloyl-ACP methyl ester carboxylesterase